MLSREGESQEEAFFQVRGVRQLGVPWGWGGTQDTCKRSRAHGDIQLWVAATLMVWGGGCAKLLLGPPAHRWASPEPSLWEGPG